MPVTCNEYILVLDNCRLTMYTASGATRVKRIRDIPLGANTIITDKPEESTVYFTLPNGDKQSVYWDPDNALPVEQEDTTPIAIASFAIFVANLRAIQITCT